MQGRDIERPYRGRHWQRGGHHWLGEFRKTADVARQVSLPLQKTDLEALLVDVVGLRQDQGRRGTIDPISFLCAEGRRLKSRSRAFCLTAQSEDWRNRKQVCGAIWGICSRAMRREKATTSRSNPGSDEVVTNVRAGLSSTEVLTASIRGLQRTPGYRRVTRIGSWKF